MSAAARFTAQQSAAIERRRGAFALAAAAGSGKTSVLVERYVRAVTEDGIAPARILAITFTDRAAGELRERVRRALVGEGRRAAARESAAAFVSTFHGFCARVLRSHAVLAGLPAGFGLLGDAQAATLRERAFDEALAGWLEGDGALELAASFGVDELRAAIIATYDELRSRGETAPALPAPSPRHDLEAARARLAAAAAALGRELGTDAPEALGEAAHICAAGEVPPPQRVRALTVRRGNGNGNGNGKGHGNGAGAEYEEARAAFEEACADALGVPAAVALDGLLGAFGERYRARKWERGMLDFDDLELEAATLLASHPEVRAQWSERFELVMVDELQDTNARQLHLLADLDRGNLFTVGDEFQSIYGFRHAEVALFRERHASLSAAGDAGVLSSNFRSRPAIVSAINAAFAPRFGAAFHRLVAARDAPAAGGGPLVELLVADSDGWEGHEERLGPELAPAPLWRRAEARLLARRLDQLIRDGTAGAEEIVVLFRAGTAIRVYETALADLGHATLATAGGGFFERPEVLDLVAYVRALANPLDDLALYSVLASPLGGWDAGSLAALTLRAREQGRAPWAVLETDPPGARAAELVERLQRARRLAAARPLAEVIAAGVAEHGYDLHLARLHGPERRLANVHKLEALARDFEAREGRDLRAFAQALAAGRVGAAREVEAPPPAAGTGAVRMMTIHAAKGLEFPVVCVADLAHAWNQGDGPLLTAPGRVGLRLVGADRERVDTLAYAALREERRRAAAAEEERIVYVALTRARERLILSGAARFAAWPREPTAAIAWLGPALVPDIATRAQRGGGVEVVEGAGGVAVRLELLGPDRIDDLLGPAPALDGTPPGADGPAPDREHDPIDRRTVPARGSAPELPSLSYSSLAEYERCGYRNHLQRVLGLADVEIAGGGEGEGASARGVVVHALLEGLDFARPAIDAGSARAVALREGLREDPAGLVELAGAFARSPLCARLAAATAVRREQPFAFALGGPGGTLLRGFLDVAGAEADGTLLVVDYKSDRVADGEDLAARVERDYALQRIVYALAGLASGARAVEVAHCFLRRPETVVAARFEGSERSRLEALLEGRLEPLRAGRFEVSGDPGRVRCGTCPGRARLCSHDEAMTLRDVRFGPG